MNTKSPHIPTSFGDENTGEVNKAIKKYILPSIATYKEKRVRFDSCVGQKLLHLKRSSLRRVLGRP
jgi:hypothetical protein